MDHVREIVIVLFILSMVWERINEFVKLYLSCMPVPFLKGKYLVRDTTTKYPEESPQEQQRKYRILKINLALGVLTAIACHADMLALMQNSTEPAKVLGWDGKKLPAGLYGIVSFLFGCLLTGAFISMGSKFWHDLLDILVAIKNVKRQAVKTAEDINSLDALPESERVEIMQAAKDEYWKKWKHRIPELTGVTIANKKLEKQGLTTGQKVLQFQVVQKAEPQNVKTMVPPYIRYSGYKIPTDVVTGGKLSRNALEFAYPGNIHEPRKCGASISRTENGNNATGTIGLRVSRVEEGKEKYYVLTCAHVAISQELNSGITEITSEDALANSRYMESPGQDTGKTGKPIGVLAEAKMNAYTDSALVALKSKDGHVGGEIHEAGYVKGMRSIGADDVDRTYVKFSGARSGLVESVLVKGYDATVKADFPAGSGIEEMHGLIQLAKSSKEGDSGAAVLDSMNNVVGIVVGANHDFTFAIPIESLQSEHNYFNVI